MNKEIVFKKGSTWFLRAALIVIIAIVLALCVFGVPSIAWDVSEFIELPSLQYPIMLGAYLTVAVFFVAVAEAFRLLNYIDQNNAFSAQSIKALKYITYCAVAISAAFAAGMPVMFMIAQKDDAPGLIIMGMVIVCAPLVVAAFAAVLRKLLQNAIDIKAENDLVV
ncbi:MAG TPA: DUF2975 domain-containing protein [Candidatus Paceibacterota bacterium]